MKQMKTKDPLHTILHRDGTVTYFSVYQQQWLRRSTWVSDEELAAQGKDRERMMHHLQAHAYSLSPT